MSSVSDPINVPVQNGYVRFSKSLQDSAAGHNPFWLLLSSSDEQGKEFVQVCCFHALRPVCRCPKL